ncbi:group II intron maturase-specific domain-containing protein [Streptomyces sp. NPDC088354]|uniref:group II intron maturase-specific domain-containing protein n=1 Tax=Streptomyces sp. NPDC088354 TaxID=3365856 RepID=UPI0037F4D26E
MSQKSPCEEDVKFQQRQMGDRNGNIRWSFRAAVSRDALKRLGKEVRSWRLRQRVNLTAEDLSQRINPIVAGWMQYYGRFHRSAL